MILCDVAREDASVIVSDLREYGIDREGSIAMEDIDSLISDAADRAEESARGWPGTRSSGRRSRPGPPRTPSSRRAS